MPMNRYFDLFCVGFGLYLQVSQRNKRSIYTNSFPVDVSYTNNSIYKDFWFIILRYQVLAMTDLHATHVFSFHSLQRIITSHDCSFKQAILLLITYSNKLHWFWQLNYIAFFIIRIYQLQCPFWQCCLNSFVEIFFTSFYFTFCIPFWFPSKVWCIPLLNYVFIDRPKVFISNLA